MKAIDLFCGLGGWVQSFPKSWDITGYDIVDFSREYPGKFVQCDLLNFNDFPDNIDIVVSSPPCTEFSKSSLPKSWACNRKKEPDIETALKLFNRAKQIINQVKPEYWIIENVRGAQQYVGKADFHIGSRYFWGNFRFEYTGNGNDVYGKYKLPPGKNRPAIRSKIPKSISEDLMKIITVEVEK